MNRYKDISILRNNSKQRYYAESKYPECPLSETDIWVVTTSGDRFDLLALQYYGDKSLWWIIATANRSFAQNSLYPPIGSQIRIPLNISDILFKYKKLNS
tara:strand:- start:223 stop:522 length:300 start_codon:yes stop_codon:yes gene_type:complete